jgi:hypothetical protein
LGAKLLLDAGRGTRNCGGSGQRDGDEFRVSDAAHCED